MTSFPTPTAGRSSSGVWEDRRSEHAPRGGLTTAPAPRVTAAAAAPSAAAAAGSLIDQGVRLFEDIALRTRTPGSLP